MSIVKLICAISTTSCETFNMKILLSEMTYYMMSSRIALIFFFYLENVIPFRCLAYTSILVFWSLKTLSIFKKKLISFADLCGILTNYYASLHRIPSYLYFSQWNRWPVYSNTRTKRVFPRVKIRCNNDSI